MTSDRSEQSGESDLLTLIASMAPVLDDQTWAFVSADAALIDKYSEVALAVFKESEGATLVIPWDRSSEFEICSAPMARITLEVHSSLEAVGLTAAVSQALASEAISANIMAGYFHDHIFVPESAGERAMACLTLLSASAEGF
jgi:hypothetical protein